jgi:hypothetical protein
VTVADRIDESVANEEIDGRILWGYKKLGMPRLGHLSSQGDLDQFRRLKHLSVEIKETGVLGSIKELKVAFFHKLL